MIDVAALEGWPSGLRHGLEILETGPRFPMPCDEKPGFIGLSGGRDTGLRWPSMALVGDFGSKPGSKAACHLRSGPRPLPRVSCRADGLPASLGRPLVRLRSAGSVAGRSAPAHGRILAGRLGTCCSAQFSRNQKAITAVPEAILGREALSWHGRIAGGSLFRLCGSSSRWACCSTSVSHEKADHLVKWNGDT
jgi:hypothetical protein